MGWYDGQGGRQVAEPIKRKGVVQNIPLPNPNTGLVECNWEDPYILDTDTNWITGIYLAKLEELDHQKQSYIIFVVRDDQKTSDILFQLPVTTYQAYNFWGGKCLYTHGSGSLTKWGAVSGLKATKVSFNRPYAQSNNPAAAYGMGAGDFLTNTRPITTHNYPASSAGWDYNMVRWLEKNGYDLGYVTSIDTHKEPELLLKSKIFVSNGHDEYWSDEMRQHVTMARDKGINLAFFSSNTMYWQIRLEESNADGAPYRTIVCYKDAKEDPIKGHKSTVNFSEIPSQGSQASLIGVQYFIDPVAGDIRIENPAHWAFEGTKLKKGDHLKGLLGYEIDGVVNESPENIIILASTPCQRVQLENSGFVVKYMLRRVFGATKRILEEKFHINRHFSNGILIFAILCGLVIMGLVSLKIGRLIPLLLILTLLFLFFAWFIKIKVWGKVTSNMTMYTTKSGSQVFATGSMQWVWGLDDFNTPDLRPARLSKDVEIITKNVLRKFGAK